MDEFAEWGEGTIGVIATDSANTEGLRFDECREQLWQRHQRDAVVCLVDCSESMFGALPAGASTATPAHEDPADAPSRTRDIGKIDMPTLDPATAMDGSVAGASQAAAHSPPSFFTMTMRSILALLKEKIICSSQDVVAIVLYNTRMSASSTDFRGVYVIQEATRIGTKCLQMVEQLEAAGRPGSAEYQEFKTRIGHSPITSTSTAPAVVPPAGGDAEADATPPAALTASSAFKFSDALWESQRIFLSFRSLQAIRRRQLFIFTNRDDPSGGDMREWNLCRSRACDLGKEGVVLEVFGFAASHTPGQSLDGAAAAVGAADDQRASGQSYSSLPVAAGFEQGVFWGPLLSEMQTASACFPASVDSDDWAVLAEAQGEAFVSGGGAVHVSGGAGTLQELLGSVVRRANPQRSFRHFLLRIGALPGATVSPSATTSSERDTEKAPPIVAVPQMAVSLYLPFVRARPPQREWLDPRTNRMLRRVVHLHACTSAAGGDGDGVGMEDSERSSSGCTNQLQRLRNEEDTTGESMMGLEEVQPDDLCHYATVGKGRVYFTDEERAKIVKAAAAGAELGFTVLFFKDLCDAVKREHTVRRSSFLHACVQRGGVHSHRLFVLFVRRLRAKQKAAIAQYCSSTIAAPRLVALVPSPDLTVHPEKRDQVPVDGLGLYVVPLPYAEDLRPVPELHTCTLVSKRATPALEDSSVDPAHLDLAKQLVSALTVSYRIDAALNPALQRQYRILQEVARRLFPLADNSLHFGIETSPGETEEENADTGGADGLLHELDDTLPDYEGMKRFSALFQSFNKEVLGSDYDASLYCPQPRTTGSAMRRPREDAAGTTAVGRRAAFSAEESGGDVPIKQLLRHAAAENALHNLTIPQFKAYLAAAHVRTGGARRKADLMELAKQHLKRSSAEEKGDLEGGGVKDGGRLFL
ncbi:hypothetical protein LSCM1_04401 [Leishmania martiniquensis]|uniref:Ku domain-containing protein n=1 Tax=Leishmania martiniquensis TaxID=1580590 RepID=A0A836H9Y2_9TRYP|nr:hypothetical protein LSCM1_04401 [Leishmania martiniquensis]